MGWKSTLLLMYMIFDSYVPQHFKTNLVFGLLHRTWFSFELFNQEM